ncbi:MAG: response regulator [Halorhabdus sp.]
MDLDAARSAQEREPVRVLVVDDDPAVAEVASSYLERRLDRVDAVAETAPQRAIERIETDASIECVISDYEMPDIDGLELYDRVADRRPELPFILFTAKQSPRLRREATEAGIAAFVTKDGSGETFDALTASVRQEAT